ncbi:ABC transporter substrate-binding protein [Chloroflexota bacterium]
MKTKFRKPGTIYLILAFALLFTASCASPPESMTPTSTQITDQLGRTVTIDKPPQRIISIAPSNTEILYALGLSGQLVAVTKYCDYPPEAKEKPNIGGYTTPNIEEIVALSPDLILATSKHKERIIPQLEEKGLTVFALDPKDLDNILASIKLVGDVAWKQDEAAKLLADMQGRITAVTDQTKSIPEEERPLVFYLTWHDPLKTSGQGTLNNELLQQAGGKNVFAEVTGSQSVDFEALVMRNPQVMIAGIGMGTGEDQTLTYLKAETRLQNTEASKNSRIYGIDMDLTGRGGPRIVEGLEQFARSIYPEIFGPPGN